MKEFTPNQKIMSSSCSPELTDRIVAQKRSQVKAEDRDE